MKHCTNYFIVLYCICLEGYYNNPLNKYDAIIYVYIYRDRERKREREREREGEIVFVLIHQFKNYTNKYFKMYPISACPFMTG